VKSVQPDPVHRPISTAVCAFPLIIHANAIDLRPLAAAVSAKGDCGSSPPTTIVVDVVLVAPPLSVTVSDALSSWAGSILAVSLTPNHHRTPTTTPRSSRQRRWTLSHRTSRSAARDQMSVWPSSRPSEADSPSPLDAST
jgi:hypothetical protein